MLAAGQRSSHQLSWVPNTSATDADQSDLKAVDQVNLAMSCSCMVSPEALGDHLRKKLPTSSAQGFEDVSGHFFRSLGILECHFCHFVEFDV